MNRLDSISVNEDRIEKKVAKLKRAHLCLYVGFVYLAVLVALRLLL